MVLLIGCLVLHHFPIFWVFILLVEEGCRHLLVGIRGHLVLTIPGDAVSCRHVLAGKAHGQQAGLGIWVVQDVFGELGDVNGGHHGKPATQFLACAGLIHHKWSQNPNGSLSLSLLNALNFGTKKHTGSTGSTFQLPSHMLMFSTPPARPMSMTPACEFCHVGGKAFFLCNWGLE